MFKLTTLVLLTLVGLTQLTYAQVNLTYLGTFQPNGKPDYLLNPDDVISRAFANRINRSLPNNYPVSRYNRHYLSQLMPSDIHICETADVWVTFFSESSLQKHTLAFYTYNTTTPLTIPPTSLTVVLPNVSQEDNILRAGNKVYLGKFAANTSIGFALLLDGFREGAINPSSALVYSTPQLNLLNTERFKKQSVLLCDDLGVRVFGFEESKRTHHGCDDDFNDLIFCVSTTPNQNINQRNNQSITCSRCVFTACSGGVSGGGGSGLESEGSLASAIAQRNFQRAKTTPSVSEDNPSKLPQFIEPVRGDITRNDKELAQYIPEQPFYTPSVKAYLSSPTDLIGVTNALKVLSVDYFDRDEQKRIAAVLATKTEDKVYNHTKSVCDRLTGSTLLDIDTIDINDVTLIHSTLKKADGRIEYTICFSVSKDNEKTATLTSFWAIDKYPAKNTYYNFQVWAEAPHLAQKVVEDILAKIEAEFTMKTNTSPLYPEVFVQKGRYAAGVLTLSIKNTSAAKTITISGKIAATETQAPTDFTQTISLNGDLEEIKEVYVGNLFNIGFDAHTPQLTEKDVLYFSDGSWGLQYDKNKSTIDKFDVKTSTSSGNDTAFVALERHPHIKGVSKDYIALFRSLSPTGNSKDMSKYSNISFNAKGVGRVELIVVKSSIKEWEKQYRTQINLLPDMQAYDIPYTHFQNETGEPLKAEDVTHIVFNVFNNAPSDNIELALENTQFNNKKVALPDVGEEGLVVYPNPTTDKVEMVFNLTENGAAYVSLTNTSGQTVFSRKENFIKGLNRYTLPLLNTPSGIYTVTVATAQKKWVSKVVVD